PHCARGRTALSAPQREPLMRRESAEPWPAPRASEPRRAGRTAENELSALLLRGGLHLHALGAGGLAGGHGRGLAARERGLAPLRLEALLSALAAAAQFPLTCSFPHRLSPSNRVGFTRPRPARSSSGPPSRRPPRWSSAPRRGRRARPTGARAG